MLSRQGDGTYGDVGNSSKRFTLEVGNARSVSEIFYRALNRATFLKDKNIIFP